MIEYDNNYLQLYEQFRKNSIHVINDATTIDYKTLFENNNVPISIDYLQIDLDITNNSTINTLIKLDEDIFDKYKFACVTFEHDKYFDNNNKTKEKSVEIFKKRGYICVFENINDNGNPFEDWYVHPDLVDMEYILKMQQLNCDKYKIINNLNSINWNEITYE